MERRLAVPHSWYGEEAGCTAQLVWRGGWLYRTVGMDILEMRKILLLLSRLSIPLPCQYADYAIPAPEKYQIYMEINM
jgi:hypothetical protein